MRTDSCRTVRRCTQQAAGARGAWARDSRRTRASLRCAPRRATRTQSQQAHTTRSHSAQNPLPAAAAMLLHLRHRGSVSQAASSPPMTAAPSPFPLQITPVVAWKKGKVKVTTVATVEPVAHLQKSLVKVQCHRSQPFHWRWPSDCCPRVCV